MSCVCDEESLQTLGPVEHRHSHRHTDVHPAAEAFTLQRVDRLATLATVHGDGSNLGLGPEW